MKIFVTGGTGFIGSHFLNKALQRGHVVIAQRRPGSKPRLEFEKHPIWVDRPLDADFKSEIQECDAVVHFASHTPNPPYASLDECLYWNVYATSKLLQQAAAQQVKKVIIAGTCFEYGLAAEGQDYVHPGTDTRPILTYPISKAAATTASLGLARHLGLKMQILRIFQVYGEGEAATRFWPSLRSAALHGEDFSMSSGDQIRDFIEVSEVAEQFLEALNFSGVYPGQPHIRNIGSGKPQTLLDFATSWWEVWGAKGELRPGELGLRPGEVNRLVANIDAIHIC